MLTDWISAWFTTHRKAFFAFLSVVVTSLVGYLDDGKITGDEWFLFADGVVTAFGVWFIPNTPQNGAIRK